MADFDPYLKWLGIREASRPINHYRLLGLELYESDDEVISTAADRQMVHIRTYQNGPNGDLSQQILNELARARRCLLVPEKKREYDQQLRQSLSSAPPALKSPGSVPIAMSTSVEPPPAMPVADHEPVDSVIHGMGIKSDLNARANIKKRERKQFVFGAVSWVSGALAAIGLGAALLGSGFLGVNSIPEVPDESAIVERRGKTVEPVDEPDSEVVKAENGPVDQANPVGDLNDLSRIAGLGGEVEDILKESSVSSIPELASMSATEVQDILRHANPGRTEDRLDEFTEWIKQAKQLIGDAKPIKKSSNPDRSQANLVAAPKVWTTKNLAAYPAPSRDALALMDQVAADAKSNRLQKMGSGRLSGNFVEPNSPRTDRVRKIVGLEENALLIGLGFTISDDEKIKTIQPVFFKRDRVVFGEGVGSPGPDSTLVLAKEGFAVGEIEVSQQDSIHSFRIRFMKMTRTGLDSRDNYCSSWYGLQTGPIATIRNKQGAPVVAFYGEWTGDDQIHSLGLVAAHPSFEPSQLIVNDLENDADVAKTEGGNDPTMAVVDPLENSSSDRDPEASVTATEREGDSSEVVVKVIKPTPTELTAALREVKKNYEDPVGTARGRVNVIGNRRRAEELIFEAAAETVNPALKYALLETAKEVALIVGDSDTALRAVRELDRQFEGFDLWASVVETVEDSSRSLLRSGDDIFASDLEENVRDLIDEAMGLLETRSADRLVRHARKAASRSGDSKAEAFYKMKYDQINELKKIQKQSESAVSKLSTDENNPQANLHQGKFLFVVKLDLDLAMICWSKSDNPKVLEIVEREQSKSADPMILARCWVELGETPKTLFGERCYERALGVLRDAAKTESDRNRQKNYRLEIRRLEAILKV